MKAKYLRDMTGPNPAYNKDQAAANALAGKPYNVPHSIPKPAGSIVEHPKAYMLVRMGIAEPADQECEEMAGVDLSAEAVAERARHYEAVEKGMSTKKKNLDAESK